MPRRNSHQGRGSEQWKRVRTMSEAEQNWHKTENQPADHEPKPTKTGIIGYLGRLLRK